MSSVSPMANAEEELKKIQDEIFNKSSSSGKSDPFKDVTPLDKMRLGYNAITTPGDEGYLDYEGLP
jgi:hypothetical protein